MLIKLKVLTGSRKESVIKKSPDSYVVSIKEKAERNMANRRVLTIIKKSHPGKSVKLIKGHHAAGKIVEVR